MLMYWPFMTQMSAAKSYVTSPSLAAPRISTTPNMPFEVCHRDILMAADGQKLMATDTCGVGVRLVQGSRGEAHEVLECHRAGAVVLKD